MNSETRQRLEQARDTLVTGRGSVSDRAMDALAQLNAVLASLPAEPPMPEAPYCSEHGVMVADSESGCTWHCQACADLVALVREWATCCRAFEAGYGKGSEADDQDLRYDVAQAADALIQHPLAAARDAGGSDGR